MGLAIESVLLLVYDEQMKRPINVTLPSGIVIDLNTPDDMMLRISPRRTESYFLLHWIRTTANKILYSRDIFRC